MRAQVLEVGGLFEGTAARAARGFLHGKGRERAVVLRVERQLRSQAVAVCDGAAALLQH